MSVIRSLYSAVTWLGQPLLRRKLARRARVEPGYAVAVEERFGHYTVPPDQGRVWVHAVSLGETRAAAILLAELRARQPALRLLLTHGTATGRAEGQKLLREGDVQVWQPWDTPGAVRRFLAHFQPSVGVLMETELWPNLVAACAAQGTPLALANARLNERSFVRTQRMDRLARPAYRALAAVWAQTEADAARLRALGAVVQGVFGNLKFDATPDATLLQKGQAWRCATGRPVVLFASSREGEEIQFLKEIMAIPGVQWLIVPRHPQRFDAVAALIEAQGLTVSRRSTWADAPPSPSNPPTVWLGDSLGEMALYYGLADVALLGGSFAPLGGQNLIEAAACGCPVVMGPHTFNFAEAADLAQAGGAALAVADMGAGVRAAYALAGDQARHQALVEAALAFAAAHRGAAARTADAVLALARPGA
jgi:3-deoxy-D-manno-octulosonic-acid transferase